MSEQPFDTGAAIRVPPDQKPGGRKPGGGRGRRRGNASHATIDLQGARDGLVTDAVPETHDGTGVFSTGPGGVEAYHYHRGDQTSQLYEQREDMQVQTRERAPELKGPGQ